MQGTQHTQERVSTLPGKTLPKQSEMRCPPVPVYMTANSPQTASTREAIREKRPISGFVSPGLIQSVWLKVFKMDVT